MGTIVIAWTEMDGMRPTGRMVRFDGYNFKPEFETCSQAHAVIWLNRGTAEDRAKAEAYAATLNHPLVRVYNLATTTKDPLGVAKHRIRCLETATHA